MTSSTAGGDDRGDGPGSTACHSIAGSRQARHFSAVAFDVGFQLLGGFEVRQGMRRAMVTQRLDQGSDFLGFVQRGDDTAFDFRLVTLRRSASRSVRISAAGQVPQQVPADVSDCGRVFGLVFDVAWSWSLVWSRLVCFRRRSQGSPEGAVAFSLRFAA